MQLLISKTNLYNQTNFQETEVYFKQAHIKYLTILIFASEITLVQFPKI